MAPRAASFIVIEFIICITKKNIYCRNRWTKISMKNLLKFTFPKKQVVHEGSQILCIIAGLIQSPGGSTADHICRLRYTKTLLPQYVPVFSLLRFLSVGQFNKIQQNWRGSCTKIISFGHQEKASAFYSFSQNLLSHLQSGSNVEAY